MRENLKIPFCHQKSDSMCCGPCCIKMLVDYYNIRKPNGDEYTKNSLIALSKMTKGYGTQARGMNEMFKRLGLRKIRIPLGGCGLTLMSIDHFLRNKVPIIASIPDPEGGTYDYHYTLISGFDLRWNKNLLIYQDPYYGTREVHTREALKEIWKGKWIWAIRPQNNV